MSYTGCHVDDSLIFIYLSVKQFYTIPIFIPEKSCPFRCVYCNQYRIANCLVVPSAEETEQIIVSYLQTIPSDKHTTIAFFGGSFTGMSIEEQSRYLSVAERYVKDGKVEKIQLSTRPDYISKEILDNLKRYNVKTIELGAQSLDENVLKISGRKHSVRDVEEAARLIKSYGFDLGLQMMIGLPEDTLEKSLFTAQKIIDLKADNTRIYPTLVIKDTALASWWKAGKYKALSLQEAIDWCAKIYMLFVNNNVQVLRVGLHPSEGLINKRDLLDGPFHVSFKELVLTKIWEEKLLQIPENKQGKLIIRIAPQAMNGAIGYYAENKKLLTTRFAAVQFVADVQMKNFDFEYRIE
ncbi:MAG: radical SAM protein [Bacteroidales bacterium]|nr:radical SAM protein [Bacteroidales bacterium]